MNTESYCLSVEKISVYHFIFKDHLRRLCENPKVNTQAHPYLHQKPQHENKQESASQLWEQYTIYAALLLQDIFLKCRMFDSNHRAYPLRLVKKCIFNFLQAGIRFDSKQIIVVRSFSVARKQKEFSTGHTILYL